MARAPTKTCPNLHRVLSDAPVDMLARFIVSKQFQKFEWPEEYRFDPDDPNGRDHATRMLIAEPKAKLLPLETEAARIMTIAGSRGQFALEGLIQEEEDEDATRGFLDQGDALARSLWCWLNRMRIFEATENILHLRLYRRYDKHYQTFTAKPTAEDGRTDGARVLRDFIAELERGLNRGAGCATDRFDIPAEDDEPAAEMYLIRHPNLPTAAREIDDDGAISKFYFRPPGEAMVVFTPSTGRLHVRADTRAMRHLVWKAFVSKALAQDVSHQPIDFQAYDISRFLADFNLPLLEDPQAVIKHVAVIRLEASIGNLSNRISVSTTIGQSIRDLIDNQPGLDRVFSRAVAIRFVEIAVRYRRPGRDVDETLSFTISDGNTSSLLSVDDPFERALGHRLLRGWGIMVEGRPPIEADFRVILPAILALWDSGADKVTGAWLNERNLDATPMIDLGFLVPFGNEEIDLIDDEDGIGAQDAKVESGFGETDVSLGGGPSTPGGSPERYRLYRVRPDWVVEYLKSNAAAQFGAKSVEAVTPNLFALGVMRVSERDVPVYLARGLQDERLFAETDTNLRIRSELGTGLVLNAGRRAGFALAGNVLLSFPDFLTIAATDPVIDLDALRSAFLRHRNLAQGGDSVRLEKSGPNAGMLYVPGKGSISIDGENRLQVIQRLVDAHYSKQGAMKTEDMAQGIGDQSLSNIFGSPLWNKLKTEFLRTPKKGKWEIAT